MDDFTANSIKELHGLYFQQYYLRKKILLKRDEQSAFLLANPNVLRECVLASHNIKWKINEKLRKLQRYSLSEKCSIHRPKFLERLQKQYKVNKKEWIRLNKQAKEPHTYFTDSQLSFHLYGTSPVVFTNASLIKHLLGTQKNGIQLYIFIIRTTIPDLIVTDYKVPIPLISPLLEQFQQQHNCFPYNGILKTLTRRRKSNESPQCKYTISKKQLKLYFNLIFSKVVPLNIFGKINNTKKIKKTLFELLFAPYCKAFSLMPLIAKLDIFSIVWLKNIRHDRDKHCLIAKFIRWFFVGYLLKILRTNFHITPVSSTNKKTLYIPRYIWKKVQHDFMKKRICSYTLQPDVQCKGWYPPIGVYKLLPKHSGIRPIFVPQYQDGDKKHLRIILQFLKQLHMSEYGSDSFQEKWQSIVKCKQNSEAKQLYFVCCDVADAFGSVKQDKLYEIIQSFCEKLPESLILKYCMVKSKIFKEDIVCYKQYFFDPNLKLSLAPGTFYAYPKHGYCQWIKKKWLLKQIEKHIFDQRVMVRNKNYIIGKGIVQGTMLSPILSDIYYNFVLHKEMATFFKAGEITKYMDDILYVTEDEIIAQQFLQLTKKGIPQFNCFFKKSKTQTNLKCDGNTIANHIVYIGYKINCTTLEVEPKQLDTDLRYAISYIRKNNFPPLATLKLRLTNIAPLKLSKFILDRRINSKETIIKILKETCLVQAKRAAILIKELFNNIKANVKSIHNVIVISNSKIARYVLKALIFRKNMKRLYMYKWNIKILMILWTSYRIIFKKDQILRKHFTHITNYPVRKRR